MSNKRQEILDWLEKNRRPEIRIQFKKAEVPLPVGVSKIGGCPDVPADFVWPRVKGGGRFGNPNAEPVDYEAMKKPDVDEFFAGSVFSAKSFEEVRAIQWAKLEERQRQDPNYQLPQGDKLKQLEEQWKQSYSAMNAFMGMQKSFLNSISDEEWREQNRPDPEFEKRSKISRPLAFMAQFNLSEVVDFDRENLLPKSGNLLFFYDYESLDGGENQDCLKVFYFPPETPLTQMPLPDDMDKDSRIPELQVSFQAGSNVPSSQRADEVFGEVFVPEYLRKGAYDLLNDDDWDKFWGDGGSDYYVPKPKLLGYADDIQGCMEESCAKYALGYGIYDWDDYNDKPEVKAQVDKDKNDWILLFQLDEIDWCDMDYTNTPVDFSGLYDLQKNIGKIMPKAGKAFGEHIQDMQSAMEKSGMQVVGKPQEEKKSFLSSLMGGIFGSKKDVAEMTAEDVFQEMQTAMENGDMQKMLENEDDDDIDENIKDEADDDMGGLCFGDGGCLYVFIRKQDLAAGRFDKVYFEVQSH